MSRHIKEFGKELRKRGLSVDVRFFPNSSKDDQAKAVDSAIKTLKRRMVQEGMVRDMKRKEFHITEGQCRRKEKADAIRRDQRARELELNPKLAKKKVAHPATGYAS